MKLQKPDFTILYVVLGGLLIINLFSTYQISKMSSLTSDMLTAVKAGSTTQAQTQGQQQPTQDTEVRMTVLNDKNCAVCDPTQIIQSIEQQVFTNLKVTEVDYNTPEGKQLATALEIDTLPAYLFDDSVTKSKNFDMISNYLDSKDGRYILRAGGSYMIGRAPSSGPQIDLFVMSQCPFGVQAENNFKEVLDNFKGKLTFNLYFIASKTDSGFSSLHGQPEVNEDIRQVCAIKNFPDKYYAYILCRNKNISDENWQSCATEAGIDTEVIDKCMTGVEGPQLLTENIKKAEELGIGGSPTFLINNQYKMTGALPADSLKELVCKANTGLEGCGNTLTQNSAAPSGGCGS